MIRRIATIGRTSPEAVAELEYGLEMRLSSMVNQQHSNRVASKASPKF